MHIRKSCLSHADPATSTRAVAGVISHCMTSHTQHGVILVQHERAHDRPAMQTTRVLLFFCTQTGGTSSVIVHTGNNLTFVKHELHGLTKKKATRQRNRKCSKCPESRCQFRRFCAATLKKVVAGPALVVVKPLTLSASQQQHIRGHANRQHARKIWKLTFPNSFLRIMRATQRRRVHIGQEVRLALWTHGCFLSLREPKWPRTATTAVAKCRNGLQICFFRLLALRAQRRLNNCCTSDLKGSSRALPKLVPPEQDEQKNIESRRPDADTASSFLT